MTFDEAVAEWVRRNIPGAQTVVGTVCFDIDWAAYDSGPRYCDFDVTWTDQQPPRVPKYNTDYLAQLGVTIPAAVRTLRTTERRHTLGNSEYDVTKLIREITEIALESSTQTQPPENSSGMLEG